MTTVWVKPEKLHRNLILASLLALWLGLAFSTALVEIAFIVAVFFFLVWKRKKHDLRIHLDPKLKFFLMLWFAVTCFSFVLSDYPEESFRGILKVGQQIVLLWMIAETFREAENKIVFEKTFLIFYGVLIFDGFFQFLTGTDFIRHQTAELASYGPRVSASFKSYGLFASYAISTIPFLFTLAVQRIKAKKRGEAALILFLFLMACALLFLTRSRGAFLAFGTGLFLMLLYLKKWKWIGLGIILTAVVLFSLPKSMVMHIDDAGREQSISERSVLWDRAIQVIKARPLLGTGINTYANAHTKYDQTQSWRVRNYYAHNGYLQMAAEIGLPGALFFLLFLFRHFQLHLKKNPDEDRHQKILRLGIFAGSLNFLLFALVDTVMHNGQSVTAFWYLAGLSLAYHQKA